MADVVARIQEFDPIEDLPENFFVIYYGLRRCGKTTMLRHMLWEMEEIIDKHKVYLFSTTAEVSPEDYEYIPPKAKFHNVAEIEVDLSKILNEQKGKIKEFNENGGEEPESILIILDDCVSESSIRHSPSLNSLAVAGRHINISVVILSQVVSGSGSVPPIIRTQADSIFVVANPRSEKERGLLAEQYLTAAKITNGKNKGLEVLAAVTDEQYRALVILTTDSSARRFEDYLFKYGPVDDSDVTDDFKLGTPDQWEEEVVKKRKIWNTKRKIQPKQEEKPSTLPNPFDFTPTLPMSGGEFLYGLSDQLAPPSSGKRRRR